MTTMTSVDGCAGCATTGSIYSCPIHSPNNYVQEEPKPFVQLFIRCPCCGIGIRFDGFTEDTVAKIPNIRAKGS